MGWKRGRVPGCGDGSRAELLEELVQELEFDLVQHVLPASLPAALGAVCSLIPALLFLRMLCSGLIATMLFLVFKLTRKTCVYSVLNYFSPSLMFVYTKISLGPCWSFPLANAVHVKLALHRAPSVPFQSQRGFLSSF